MPLPFSRFSATCASECRGVGQGVDERVDLLLAFRVRQQGRDRAVSGPHALVDLRRAATAPTEWRRRATRSSLSRTSRRSGAGRPGPGRLSTLARIALSECSAALKLLPSCTLSSLLEVIAPRNPSPFSVRPRMFLQRLGDRGEVGQQVAAALQKLLEAGCRAPAGSRRRSRPPARRAGRPRARCTCRRGGRGS